MISRRTFLSSSLAFAACTEIPFAAEGAVDGRKMRLGVIADLHVKSEGSTDTFEKALRFFDAQKVDGVVCAGDLATSGIVSELERIGRAWFNVFPDNCRSDGAHVEKLFIYGDHDMGGYAWKESRGLLSDEELHAQTIPTHDPGAIWERCFREPWQPVQVKTVNGFSFVLAHHPPHEESTAFGNYNPHVAPVLAAHAKELKNRPFFYVQHRPIPCLADEDTVWRKGDARISEILRKYPNCVALTGHTHRNCTDDRLVWQGEFTALNIPCLRYLTLGTGRENSHARNKEEAPGMMMGLLSPRDGQQGYLVDVTEKKMVVHRLDFSYSCGAVVAPPWRIPIAAKGSRPYAHESMKAKEVAPRFPKNAEVTVRMGTCKNRKGEDKPSFVLSFPPALSTANTPRAFDYEIEAKGELGTVVKRVFSKKCYLPEVLDGGNVVFILAREFVGDKGVTFTVRPCGCFGTKGEPIQKEWKKPV